MNLINLLDNKSLTKINIFHNLQDNVKDKLWIFIIFSINLILKYNA